MINRLLSISKYHRKTVYHMIFLYHCLRVTEAFVTGIDVMLTRYPHEDQAWGASSDTEDETSSRKCWLFCETK